MMDFNWIRQPEHHFRFFDLCEEPKKIIQSSDDYAQIPLVTMEEAVQPLIEFVSQVREMLQLVKDKCRLQTKGINLSTDESASILLYTMEWIPREDSFYYIFNRKLSSNDLQPWYLYLKLLSTSLRKLPRSTHRILYRAIQSDLQTSYPTHKNFFWYGYSSWSSSIAFFNSDKTCFDRTKNRTLLILHSEQGIDISACSFYSIKQEILLAPRQRFQVVSCRVSADGLCIVMLKEVSNQFEPMLTATIDRQQLETFDRFFEKRIRKLEEHPEINLTNQNLTDSHMQIIVKYAIQRKKCHWLSLKRNQITSHGLCILANGLANDQSLQSLYLEKNFIDDSGVEYFTKILAKTYSNLTFLSLNHNRIEDRGVQYLANMLKTNNTLTDLWLSYNAIGNEGVRSLAEVLLSKSKTLIQLYLNGNPLINDSIVRNLVLMLKVNQTLNTLWLQDCNLTKRGREELESSIESRVDFDLYV